MDFLFCKVSCDVKPPNTSQLGVKFETSSLNSKESFKCTAEDLYKALTVPEVNQFYDSIC